MRHGADASVRRNAYETPLLVDAVECNDLELLKLLLTHGAAINDTGDQGVTALVMTLRDSRLALFEFLLSQGPNVNIQDQDGKTPLMWAVEDGYDQAVERLLRHGANTQLRDKAGQTVLNYFNDRMDQARRTTLLRLLKKAGAK